MREQRFAAWQDPADASCDMMLTYEPATTAVMNQNKKPRKAICSLYEAFS
jgi:hypothetical protein